MSRDGVGDARAAAAAAASARRANASAAAYAAAKRRGMTDEERAERRVGLMAEVHGAPLGASVHDAGQVGLRPVGGLEWMAESSIAQALRSGALSGLRNEGKPLPVRPEEQVPWAIDPTEAALRRTIKSQGFKLESIECRDAADELRREIVGSARAAGGSAGARTAVSARLGVLIKATRAFNDAVTREQLASRSLTYPIATRPMPTVEQLLDEAGVRSD